MASVTTKHLSPAPPQADGRELYERLERVQRRLAAMAAAAEAADAELRRQRAAGRRP